VGGEDVDPVALDVVPDAGSPFDDFYRREYRALLQLAWSLTGGRHAGEDLVQEVMLTVQRRWPVVRTYESPGGFARRVLLNSATSAARRRAAERRALGRLRSLRVPPMDEPPPEDELWSALRALPARQAQVVALHYVEDLAVAEIASVLGIAEGSVKVHLHRGRLALAKTLRPEDGGR
jgi:RNA polymerase sigma-70 factor (ECF subfamily)